ncbi:unnamed protein product [Ceutorhynchus assimilis]|uniref:Uncharacterized protein n=1 Tax=Ceutorhynchus assimilis TaxID=467358 RepID=A0A9N9MX58_9CUCU|nr:unnamed protein product [Ceutorhynchus assimilis]
MSSYERDVTSIGSGQDIDSLAYKISERSKRPSNVMMYNVPHSNSSNLQERIDNDEKHVANVLTTLGLSEVKQNVLKTVHVCQITEQKVRPLKVVFTSPEVVTKQQQEIHKKVQTELKYCQLLK